MLRSARDVRVGGAGGETTTPGSSGTHQEKLMSFDTLEMSLTVLELLAPIEAKVRQRRKSLAEEIGTAAESIALNTSEARQRAGLDRADLFRRAAGSAAELTTALRIARARGYISSAEHAAIDAALDRVRAMLWRLTH
ncbi:MAG: four helix bundle protein [Kofleriaceae bacterium]